MMTEQVLSPTNIHSACTTSCSFGCSASSTTTECFDDDRAAASSSCCDDGDEHHQHATNMPLVVGPALVSSTAVANGCKSCYTRPPHLRAKCCGPGKAKLFKKKSKILGAVLAQNGILSELLEKEEQEAASLSYIHLTQFTSVVGEGDHNNNNNNNCTKEFDGSSSTSCNNKEHLDDETLIEQANHNNLPPIVDVSTHQEAIEKPSRMRSFLSGLLQRKQKVMVTLGFSESSTTTSSDSPSPLTTTTTTAAEN